MQVWIAGATYFIDDLKWVRAGYNGCIDDHETAATSIDKFTYFANGHLEAEGYTFEIVNNPNPTGVNLPTKVGKFVKASDGAPFAGMYADLGAPIDFKGVKTIKAKVHMDHMGNFAVKLEGSAIGAPAIELPVANTKTNQWEELTYDFSSVPDNAEYQRLTLFFDLTIDATGQDVTSYFDDLVVGTGACAHHRRVQSAPGGGFGRLAESGFRPAPHRKLPRRGPSGHFQCLRPARRFGQRQRRPADGN